MSETSIAINPAIPKMPQLNGIFVLDKPVGPSSAQCLKVFKRLGQKKIGHAGTLDPLASGVLLVLLGQATKLSSYLLAEGKKIYSGVLRLGLETDTWDIEGNIVAEKSCEDLSQEAITTGIAAWTEIHEQLVPPYSAAKHQGQPLYKLARKGMEVPVKYSKISVSKADMLEICMPFVRFRVTCSSGSYIRSLAHGLGKRLGCGAVLQELTREYSHPFGLESACKLEVVQNDPTALGRYMTAMTKGLPSWPVIELTTQELDDVRNGRSIPAGNRYNSGNVFLCKEGIPVAVAKLEENAGRQMWKVVRGLWN